jgi:hypothetical protein
MTPPLDPPSHPTTMSAMNDANLERVRNFLSEEEKKQVREIEWVSLDELLDEKVVELANEYQGYDVETRVLYVFKEEVVEICYLPTAKSPDWLSNWSINAIFKPGGPLDDADKCYIIEQEFVKRNRYAIVAVRVEFVDE